MHASINERNIASNIETACTRCILTRVTSPMIVTLGLASPQPPKNFTENYVNKFPDPDSRTPQQRRELKKLAEAGSCYFPTDRCKFQIEEIMGAQNLNLRPLPLNYPTMGDFQPQIVYIRKKILPRRNWKLVRILNGSRLKSARLVLGSLTPRQ